MGLEFEFIGTFCITWEALQGDHDMRRKLGHSL